MTIGTLSNLECEEFIPRRWLRNSHLQTLAGNFFPRVSILPAPEERLISAEDGAQLLCHCHWQRDRQQRGTVIIVHGLEGSSLSQYVVGTGSKAWTLGMNVIRMNMRNCGGTEHLTSTLYHSGLSSDVAAVLRQVVDEDKLPRVGLVGFSMGGNLVLKLAGDWGVDAPSAVKAVAAVSPAADLAASADAMHHWSNRVYEWRFLFSLLRRFDRKVELFPAIYKPLDSYPKSIREFDDVVTARYCGFRDADDYYERAAAATVIDRIALPTLIIHATDDPFIRLTPATRTKIQANPHISLVETRYGGHCAFMAEPNGYDGHWAEKRVNHFWERHGLSKAYV